jgi:hypothetical protein
MEGHKSVLAPNRRLHRTAGFAVRGDAPAVRPLSLPIVGF